MIEVIHFRRRSDKVNQPSTGVRLVHEETGISATCSEHRSLNRNLREARTALLKEIRELSDRLAKQADDYESLWKDGNY